MHLFFQLLVVILAWHCKVFALVPANQLCSTTCDPDAIIERCVNVINGDFCEAVTDLIVPGPEPLVLQRFHNAKNYVTGSGYGGWRLLPQTLLVMGKDPKGKACKVRGEQFETYGSDGQSHYTVSKTYNSIGQVLTETDPEGKITSYTYNACGELQLIYFGKRYYDPELAVWLTTDPVGFVDSLNLYQYALNNPFHYYDPDGEFIIALPLLIWGAELILPSLSACVAPIIYGAITSAVAVAAWEGSKYVNNAIEKRSNQGTKGSHNSNVRPSTREKHEYAEGVRKKQQEKAEAKNQK